MSKPQTRGLQRIINAAGYSIKGLSAAWRYEEAFRQESVLMMFLTPFAFFVGADLVQILFLLTVSWLIIIAELINSAIEALVDYVSQKHHPLLGRAKDIGSAAVFITLCLNAVIWTALIGRNLLGIW